MSLFDKVFNVVKVVMYVKFYPSLVLSMVVDNVKDVKVFKVIKDVKFVKVVKVVNDVKVLKVI